MSKLNEDIFDKVDNDLDNEVKEEKNYDELLERLRKQVEEESAEKSIDVVDSLEETKVINREDINKVIEKESFYKKTLNKEEEKEDDDIVVDVIGLKKRIGLKTIVEDINFVMRRGEIVGLLGPNGSGKTTIMRMMTGLTKKTKGEVYCLEREIGMGKTSMLKEVGSMIETPEFYNYLSGYANLKQIARLCGKQVSKQKIKDLVEFVGLSNVIHKKVKTYSLGMRQRLGLAQALLNDPQVLILDEPVNGLDPQGVKDFREKLQDIASSGVSVLVSSHLLDEVEKLTDRIIVINKGKIIADSSVSELGDIAAQKTLLSVYDKTRTESLLNDLGVYYTKEKAGFVFDGLTREEQSKIVTYLVTNYVEIKELKTLKRSLEERFLEITKGGER